MGTSIHDYWKSQPLTRQTFVGKVISLLFNMLSRLVCCTIALISHDSKVVLKILQARLQQYVNCEIPDIQAGFRKVEDQIRSDQISHSVVSDSLRPHESQHTRPPCPSPTPRVHSDSRPSSRWCHSAISSSVVPFSSRPQSLPASESEVIFSLNFCSELSLGINVDEEQSDNPVEVLCLPITRLHNSCGRQ